jgi:hypothetical protein
MAKPQTDETQRQQRNTCWLGHWGWSWSRWHRTADECDVQGAIDNLGAIRRNAVVQLSRLEGNGIERDWCGKILGTSSAQVKSRVHTKIAAVNPAATAACSRTGRQGRIKLTLTGGRYAICKRDIITIVACYERCSASSWLDKRGIRGRIEKYA